MISSRNMQNNKALLSATWQVVKSDAEIPKVYLYSGIISVFLALLAVVPIILVGFSGEGSALSIGAIIAVYLTSLAGYCVVSVAGGVATYIALQRFQGQRVTVGFAFNAIKPIIKPLVLFGLFNFVVGSILRFIQDRVPLGGVIVAALVGFAWGVATIFTIPHIVAYGEQNVGTAVKASVKTVKDVWRDGVFAGVALGVLGFVAGFVIFLLSAGVLVAAVATSSAVVGILGAIVVVAALCALAIVTSALNAVAVAAAYYYSVYRQMPAGFNETTIQAMFKPKKKTPFARS